MGTAGGTKMEHAISEFMNEKIEVTLLEEDNEERQLAMGTDNGSSSAPYPAPSSSSSSGSRLQVPVSGQGSGGGGSHGLGGRPSSRGAGPPGEIQSSAHEGTVSSTGASSSSSELAEPSQTLDGEGGGRLEASQPSSESASFMGGRGGGAVSTSSAGDNSSPTMAASSSSAGIGRAMSPSVGSSQPSAPAAPAPPLVAKKRIMHRPRFRGDDPQGAPAPSSGGGGGGGGEKFGGSASGGGYPASSSRGEHNPRNTSSAASASSTLPSTTSGTKASGIPADVQRAVPPSKAVLPTTAATAGGSSSGGGKEKKSDLYDFPDDSPDEECSGRTPSSYMALGTPGRSPRKGHVDSSDSVKTPGGDTSAMVGSSTADDRRCGTAEETLDSSNNEAQGYESYGAPSSSSSSHPHSHPHHYPRRGEANVDSGSVVVDSTHGGEKPGSSSSAAADDSAAIDSSTAAGERKAGKRLSPRRAPDDPSEGFEPSESAAGRLEGLGGSYPQHSRSPRARAASTEGVGGGFGGVDSSSSDRSPMGGSGGTPTPTPSMGMVGYPAPYPPNPGSGQPVVSSIMREPEHGTTICSRDQEPAPLLSSQYETLSDDDDN